jgi:riboflavin kinase
LFEPEETDEESNSLETLVLKGRIFTGKSEGAKFIRLRWVQRQIKEKLGSLPYRGTLNIRLTEESIGRKKALTRTNGLEILPATGYCGGKLFRAHLGNVECAVVSPEIADYPEDVIEVIASVNLRRKLGLADGDFIKVDVMF